MLNVFQHLRAQLMVEHKINPAAVQGKGVSDLEKLQQKLDAKKLDSVEEPEAA
ncbi:MULTISPECIES: hypothetical protein [Salipiger]|uniref:hypothetical protein n=1 Tax=Salipiger TaxID=263377 RepID=UPI00351237AF